MEALRRVEWRKGHVLAELGHACIASTAQEMHIACSAECGMHNCWLLNPTPTQRSMPHVANKFDNGTCMHA